MKKIEKLKEGVQTNAKKSISINKHGELKTDRPLSEKDEVKQAEDKMRKTVKKKD